MIGPDCLDFVQSGVIYQESTCLARFMMFIRGGRGLGAGGIADVVFSVTGASVLHKVPKNQLGLSKGLMSVGLMSLSE